MILNSTHKIVTVNTFDKRTNKTYQRFNIKFCSKEMVTDLHKLGLTNNKSATVLTIDSKFHWDLVRGIFDGDGSIHYTCTKKLGQLRFSIIGSYNTIVWLEQFFEQNNLTIKKRVTVEKTGNNMYRVIFSVYNALDIIKEYIYKTCSYRLNRKYDLFQTLKEYQNGGYSAHKYGKK